MKIAEYDNVKSDITSNSLKNVVIAAISIFAFFAGPAFATEQNAGFSENFTDTADQTMLSPTVKDEKPNTYLRGKVIKILEEGEKVNGIEKQEYQVLDIEILNGEDKGKLIKVGNGVDFVIGVFHKFSVGEKVVLAKTPPNSEIKSTYYIIDKYRAGSLAAIVLFFFALAIFFGRRRGLTSIVGMIFSVFVVFYFIIPQITKGADPLWTSVLGGIAIMVVSLYLSHGFNKRTTIALFSTMILLFLAVIIDFLFVHFAKLSGNGTEEAFFLQFDNLSINLRNLLMGGIFIGVLGVLDDVTTGLAAAIEEIHKNNTSLGFYDLYQSGLSIGREHIASLINTLVLAYVGASFPLLLLYSSQKLQPLWVTINSNFIAEEIIRTMVGSSVLVIAVPLTTFLAAFYYSKDKEGSVPFSITEQKEVREKIVNS